MTREVVLDTETTGRELRDGHRIIEIACLEIVDRRITGNELHLRFNPGRPIDPAATAVHGLSDADLIDAPPFAEHAGSILGFMARSSLVIHNAAFDIGFLDAAFAACGAKTSLRNSNPVVDTLTLARRLHPGRPNNLSALCLRYGIDPSGRLLHGALLDARLLARVYLSMTAGQPELIFDESSDCKAGSRNVLAALNALAEAKPIPVLRASESEKAAHDTRMEQVRRSYIKTLAGRLSELERSAVELERKLIDTRAEISKVSADYDAATTVSKSSI